MSLNSENATEIPAACPYSGASLARAVPAEQAPRAAHSLASQTVASPSYAEQTSEEDAPSSAKIAPPADASVFYDPLSYSAYDNPYELYKTLREKAPVYYNERRNLWVVSRYADVSAIFDNHEQFSNHLGNDMDGTHDSYAGGILVAVDPPRHTGLRQSVRRVFALRELLAREEGLRELAKQLLADLQAQGGGDFASEVALPLVIGTGAKLVGLPAGDEQLLQDHLLRSMERTVGAFGIPADAAASNQEEEVHLNALIEERAAELAGGADVAVNDVLTQILLASEKGKIDDSDNIGIAHLILSASIDAPGALLTNLVHMLDKFPAYQSFLRENPEMIPAFVEETLRFDTPGQNLCRQTMSEVTVAGVTIPNDSKVMILLASANRDEAVYENPEVFDITREYTPHNKIMSFGKGIHACVGSPLARLAGRVLVEELVKGPEIRIVGTPKRWIKQMVRGFEYLPVKFITDDFAG